MTVVRSLTRVPGTRREGDPGRGGHPVRGQRLPRRVDRGHRRRGRHLRTRRSTGTSVARTHCLPRCCSTSASACARPASSGSPWRRRPTEALDALIARAHRVRARRPRADHRARPRAGQRARARPPADPPAAAAVRRGMGHRPERAPPGGTSRRCSRAATHAVFGLLNSTPHSAGELSRDAMATSCTAWPASPLPRRLTNPNRLGGPHPGPHARPARPARPARRGRAHP